MTNLSALASVGADAAATVIPYPSAASGRLSRAAALWRGMSCDYILVNCSPRDLFEVCLIKWLSPFSRARIVSLDTVLPVPQTSTFGQRLSLWIKQLLFRQPHLFIEYFRQTEGYQRHYRIPARKFRYVPFKINRYERVLSTPTRDDGYIFCGGNTRRDFATLFAAVKGLPYPVRVVTMADNVIAGHGSSLNEASVPDNVTIVRHDGSDSFLDHIAASRLVVLPIRKQNISASGIGVYLASMALGKCVVISEGPAVNGVVPDGAAVVVPAEEPQALREAVIRAFDDDVFRQRVAAAGASYARALEGEQRLCTSVLTVLLEDSRSADKD